MDIASILSGAKSSAKEHYWAVVIEPGWTQAGIWEIEGEKAQIISLSPPAAWEVEEELIGAADTALSAAIQNLPEDIGEPTKTVFGVPPSWVSEGQITAEHLEKIKRICAELSLEPTGFVVLPEAIAHLFKSEEGSPLNAVVVGLGDANIDIAVFRLGNLAGNAVVARSVSIADDVAEGLARFAGTEALPSRILLYDGKEGELEEIRQTLLKTSWEENEKIKFLHTPKIEVIEPDRKVLATALAGASEISDVSAIETLKKEFVEPEADVNVVEPETPLDAKDLGFVVGEDVAKKVPAQMPPIQEAAPRQAAPLIFFNRVKNAIVSWLTKPTTAIAAKESGFGISKRILTTGVISLGILFIFIFLLWWFIPKADVVIYVSPKKIEEKSAITFDSNSTSANVSEKVLIGKSVTTNVTGEKTKATSGTKVVGEKAKGSVKLQNGTATNINLPLGTVLTGAGDLKFSLNTTASVSAAISPSQPGTATVDVTAIDIGNQYNLAKDESFKVGNYPKADVDATAIANFTGGTSRDISAVSDEDQKILEDDLVNELLEKAKLDLAGKGDGDFVFIPESISYEAVSKSFSNKVGDEASTLKLSLEMDVVGIVTEKKALSELAREVLKEKTPTGFALRDEQLTFRYELENTEKGIFEMNVTFGANLLPELKFDEIKKNISGRSPQAAENYLTSIPGFTRAEIKITRSLPGRLKVLPRIAKNITIEVSAEK